ncbi:GNAT family N-acetyltransferase [Tsuneonella mangrovi]|uniref:GNAT family N-acetyltransferase n=1 Tax=Tsuneonella mangrovi TaxID=1982042 RepID=UPI0014723E08|nr:GNAT family N-acetyltransferase [Tsuneonella mangrovi]
MTRLRLIDPATLTPADHAAWDRLGASAGRHPAFTEPWFMRQSLAHCRADEAVSLAVVEDGDGEWIGMLPLARAGRHGRAPMPHVRAWFHPNQFQVAALVREGMAISFWEAMLDGLEEHFPGRIAIGLQCLATDYPGAQALLAVCREQGRTVAIDQSYERAILRADPGGQVPPIGTKQAARIRSLERKIERELGPLRFTVTRDPDKIAAEVDGFLALERSGWKGKNGSALSCDPETEAFFRAVVEEGSALGRFELAQLHAGDRPIAQTTLLTGRHGCFGFKMAFDGQYAQFGPGLVLMTRYTQSLVERGVGLVDSCSAPNQQPISRLWPERTQLVDVCVALNGPIRQLAFRSILALEGFHARVIRGAPANDEQLAAVGG